MALIRFEAVTKKFGTFVAVDDVTIDIKEGEFFSLLGPSGCGKTTLLRMLAGLEHPTSGRILLEGQDITELPAGKRGVNMVFQSYAVFPHMSVLQNVAYGLKMDGVGKKERLERAREALDLVQLSEFRDRMPDQLSGGQRQRVAVARALVKRPKVLLLDEPLSALDAKLRDDMRNELVKLQQQTVTHDQSEALATADRCAIMKRGMLQQVATPDDLYEFPANRFVADFIGTINLIEGVLSVDETNYAQVSCPSLSTEIFVDHGISGAESGTVWVGIRPEKITMTPVSDEPATTPGVPNNANRLLGSIMAEAYLGSESIYDVRCSDGSMFKVRESNSRRTWETEFKTGDEVWLSWLPSSPIILQS